MEPKKIFVVLKCAKHETGEWVMATTEKAFATEEKAKAFISGQPIIWSEMLNGCRCDCERAVHITDLE
jgi:hypothetical protein